MNVTGKRRGWFRRRRDARIAENLGVLQAEISTLGLDYDGALNRFDDLVESNRVAEAFDFAEQAKHSLDAGTRRAVDITEGDALDEDAFSDLVRDAIALNRG